MVGGLTCLCLCRTAVCDLYCLAAPLSNSLQVPLTVMMGRGTEDVVQPVGSAAVAVAAVAEAVAEAAAEGSSKTSAAARSKEGPKPKRQQQQQQQQEKFDWRRCGIFAACFLVWSLALMWLSDTYLHAHPEAQCLRQLPARLLRSTQQHHDQEQHQQQMYHSGGAGGCWLLSSHGFALSVADYTPNIGLFWYFLTELFDAFRPFFKFVLHSHSLLLAAPLALRFPRRPLFVAWVLLLTAAALRPYPSAGDFVPWTALAPLALAPQLRQLRTGLFLVNALLLLCVLGPAMWHQWIVVDAANPNFFYSITLLLGVYHVIVLVQAVLLTVRVERMAAGKAVEVGEVGRAAGGDGGKRKVE